MIKDQLILYEQLKILKQIRMLLLILTGSIILPIVTAIILTILSGYWFWNIL